MTENQTGQISDYQDTREKISGTFTRQDIDQLNRPAAWSGFISDEERRERSKAISDIAQDAMELFDHSELWVKTVTIKNGEIISYDEYAEGEIEA